MKTQKVPDKYEQIFYLLTGKSGQTERSNELGKRSYQRISLNTWQKNQKEE